MKIGVSACLLGNLCRYDGGHAQDQFVLNVLNKYFDMVSYCPEDKLFGSPRETIRLVEENETIKVMSSNGEKEVTKELKEVSKVFSKNMKEDDLCGFVLKSKSPTCGMERVKVFQNKNAPAQKKGVGIFAQAIKKRYPYLPMEEEGRLNDDWIKENFLMQVFAYEDLHNFLKNNPSKKDLVHFHTQYKYLIYSKSTLAYKRLGTIVSNQKKSTNKEILKEYKQGFLEAISEKSSIKKTYNVLQHIIGYFKKNISKPEKQVLIETLEEFKKELVPLVTVITLINLFTIRFDVKYLKQQKFLNPYPKELALRSNIRAFR